MQTIRESPRRCHHGKIGVQGCSGEGQVICITHFTTDGTFSPPPSAAKRPSNTMHSHPCPLQFRHGTAGVLSKQSSTARPVYFVKHAIFGGCCKSLPQQVNYLIEETFDIGKGSNAIASMLHHLFEHHGLGEKTIHLHTDNCGQVASSANASSKLVT